MKKKYINRCLQILLCTLLFSVVSCKKFLDEKPDKKMVVISSLQDLQGLLENYNWVNKGVGIGEAAADNYFVTNADYNRLSDDERNLYTWNPERVFRINASSNPWSQIYDNVYRANTVLFNLENILRTANDQSDWNNVKGQAYFLRAKSFLNAASIWSLAYDKQTASTDLGIPLRLDPDFNVASARSNMQQTFDQIISDLKESISRLPLNTESSTRPSQPAACALLARTYLYMREYDSCYRYANRCIEQRNGLVDYNSLNVGVTFPFSSILFENNPEVLYYSLIASPTLLISSYSKVDTLFYQSHDDHDLRKQVYYRSNGDGTFFYRGSYLGSSKFDGLSIPEVYLMRAECAARKGLLTEALSDLNTVLAKRWKTGHFSPFTTTDLQEALQKILAERRKELAFRDLRWMDIKRLNKEGAGIVLKRIISNQDYILSPNDLRYAMAIPEDIISMTGMQQNPR
ncbi:MAG: RagB/SusD family nutrient uptake outer membrane protein [Chitinophagaceae bacterium]|nr:RagB/SusD family nutrient uptake outer membrane protein [Chitinophagaceae bacterium]